MLAVNCVKPCVHNNHDNGRDSSHARRIRLLKWTLLYIIVVIYLFFLFILSTPISDNQHLHKNKQPNIATKTAIPHYDLEIQVESLESGIISVINHLLPDWNVTNVSINAIDALGVMYKVMESQAGNNNAVMIKLTRNGNRVKYLHSQNQYAR